VLTSPAAAPGPAGAAARPVLRATGVSVSFGGVHAVVDVDLEVGEGRLVGLIGPNGAGKTTFIDAISGFVRSRGRVELDGEDLTRLRPHVRARRGLARTWQSVELFDDLSVRENLLVASHRPSTWQTLRETVSPPGAGAGEAEPVLELLDLQGIADAMPSELSQGQRKLVGIARALVVEPRLVCLDEPAAGLDTRESQDLGRRLRRLADGGQAMLLVDHDMGLVLGICDEVVVLEFGRVIAGGAADEVRRDPKVVAAYLGSAASELAPGDLAAAAPPAPGAAPGAGPAGEGESG
jgi:branched-chain amino acid transport system ATP-binding protein